MKNKLTISQSKYLFDKGICLDFATSEEEVWNEQNQEYQIFEVFSTGDLMDIIPVKLKVLPPQYDCNEDIILQPIIQKQIEDDDTITWRVTYPGLYNTSSKELIDAVFDMIVTLIENNHICNYDKNELINFQQAKCLKEFGFNENSLFYYTKEDNPTKEYKLTRTYRNLRVNHNSSIDDVSAPTLYQVKDWLQNKYGWSVELTRISDKEWQYRLSGNNVDAHRSINKTDKKGSKYNSSELALSAGISALLQFLSNKKKN